MPHFTLVGFGSFSGLKEAGGFGLKGVAAATPIGFAFASFGFFAKLLLTAESFGKGFSREKTEKTDTQQHLTWFPFARKLRWK